MIFQDLLERAEGGEDETKDFLDEAAVNELEAASNDLQEQLDIIADMIQTPTYHPRPYQVSFSSTILPSTCESLYLGSALKKRRSSVVSDLI